MRLEMLNWEFPKFWGYLFRVKLLGFRGLGFRGTCLRGSSTHLGKLPAAQPMEARPATHNLNPTP